MEGAARDAVHVRIGDRSHEGPPEQSVIEFHHLDPVHWRVGAGVIGGQNEQDTAAHDDAVQKTTQRRIDFDLIHAASRWINTIKARQIRVANDQGLPVGRRHNAVPTTAWIRFRVEDEFVGQLYRGDGVGRWKPAILGQRVNPSGGASSRGGTVLGNGLSPASAEMIGNASDTIATETKGANSAFIEGLDLMSG